MRTKEARHLNAGLYSVETGMEASLLSGQLLYGPVIVEAKSGVGGIARQIRLFPERGGFLLEFHRACHIAEPVGDQGTGAQDGGAQGRSGIRLQLRFGAAGQFNGGTQRRSSGSRFSSVHAIRLSESGLPAIAER